MSIEEKAKAYDEALDRMKHVVIVPKNEKALQALKETIFPELRESEDERIRKRIKGLIYHNDALLDKDELLAWLEKQKERGPLTKDEEYTLHRIIEYFEDETCPSEWISLLHDIYCLPYAKQKEQKPIEDVAKDITKNKESAIKFLKSAGIMDDNGELAEMYRSEQKPSEQKEQKLNEWSKKDKRILQSLHHVMNCADAQNAVKRDGLSVEDVCTFLFSVQPSWKPTEEQMEAFRKYIEDFQARAEAAVGGWNNFDIMIRLYEQLKKL